MTDYSGCWILQGGQWWWVTTYTTDSTAAPDAKTYSQGFEDGWAARGAADGKPT